MEIEKGLMHSAKKLMPGDTFQFDCHSGLACFGKCCRMELRLTPYDILRIRSNLKISTAKFLDYYTFTRIDPESGFPLVILKQGRKGRCEFLRSYGCFIYDGRPGACRSFPLARGIDLETGESSYYFQSVPHYCEGGRQQREWSVEEWRQVSGLETYGRWNAVYVRILGIIISRGTQSYERNQLNQLASIIYDFDTVVPGLCKSYGYAIPEKDDDMMEMIEKLAFQVVQ